MKKVFIKYNPYKLETEIRVDENPLAKNSKLGERVENGTRLQEWVEHLPKDLMDEYNDTEFSITFHGTLMDYDDLKEILELSKARGDLSFELKHRIAKETEDKEKLIDKVFQEIQKGPIDELKDTEILNAFNHAKGSEFEVCVVATMSAGKSTLINSMLGTKLLPSKQEACTAIITKIKDIADDGSKRWNGEAYNKNGQIIESDEELTYSIMDKLNSNEKVSLIKVRGDIPFVSNKDVSLVLVDTPGPNNSRDPQHKKVQSEFLSNSSKSLVIYIMEGTFGSNDDNLLLERVAESMKVGGKQSRDRFLFVVNKMDNRRDEDGPLLETLDRIRAYLKEHGIHKPNIFPSAALTALDIRLLENDFEVNEDILDEIEFKTRKINRKPQMHLEKYSNIPQNLKEDILVKLNKTDNDYEKALIHTGIISIEAAIRQYVEKYAKTSKIKNIVDTFLHKLEEIGCFEETKKELMQNKEESNRLVKQIKNIQKKIDDVKSFQNFQSAVDETVEKLNEEFKFAVKESVLSYENKITNFIDNSRGKEFTIEEAKIEISNLKEFTQHLETNFETELENLIQNNLISTADRLYEEYRKKLISLNSDVESIGFKIEPLKLVGSSVFNTDTYNINNFVKVKEVVDGIESVKNPNRKWFNPFTWKEPRYIENAIHRKVEYISASELVQEYFSPLQDNFEENKNQVIEYTLKQSHKLANNYNREFGRLDEVLKAKLEELISYSTDKDNIETKILETENKLKWLNMIKNRVESILEI